MWEQRPESGDESEVGRAGERDWVTQAYGKPAAVGQAGTEESFRPERQEERKEVGVPEL